MTTHYSLQVLRVQDIARESEFYSEAPSLYVEVKAVDHTVRTRTIKNDASPAWEDERLTFSSSDTSIMLNIQIKQDTAKPEDPCIGFIHLMHDVLLKKCTDGEAPLSLTSNEASPAFAGTVYLCLENVDVKAAVELRIKGAIQAVQQRRIYDSPGAASFTTIEDANQLGILRKSFESLLKKLGTFIQNIDKAHPCFNLVWQITSVLYKVVSKPFKTDKKVVSLVRAMEEAFDFVNNVEDLPHKVRDLEQTIIGLLKQTIECCLFVQHCTGYGSVSFSSGRILDSSSSLKVEEIKQSFVDLQNALDSGKLSSSTIISARMSEKVDALYLQTQLQPDEMDRQHDLCLPGTRGEVGNEIMDCMLSGSNENIVWLYDVAGSGKSTISKTIAENFRGIHRLGASLFFERGKSDPDSVIRTVAYRLALFDSSIASHIVAAVKKRDEAKAASASSATQFDELILQPLTATAADMQGPVFIILDALDECGTPGTRGDLLRVLMAGLPKLPSNFRFLMTSRPEADLKEALTHQPSVRGIDLGYNSGASHDDVLRYIRHEMQAIISDKKVKMPEEQSWDMNMVLLGNAADGLFIWASTAVRLVQSSDDPLRTIEDLTVGARKLNLDELYATVLTNSGTRWDDKESKARFQQVLGLILLSKFPLSIAVIDGILDFTSQNSSRSILSGLQSLLRYTHDGPIRLFHASFSDYLTRPERANDSWFIDIPYQKLLLTTRCFEVVKGLLHFDAEASNVRQDGIKKVPVHLEYACLFWVQYLHEVSYLRPELGNLSDIMVVIAAIVE